MNERSSKRKKKDHDFAVNAFRVMEEATREPDAAPEAPADTPPEQPKDKNPAAVELGRRGGLKGGKARAAKLTPEQRREIGRIAAAARWKKTEG